MIKGLEALQEIKSKPFSWEKLKDSLDIIEKELKQAKENEEMLNVFKNALTIERKPINNIHAFKKDREGCISGLASEIIEIKQNELNEKMRKSLREWVLKNAFTKELKDYEQLQEDYDNLKEGYDALSFQYDRLKYQKERQDKALAIIKKRIGFLNGYVVKEDKPLTQEEIDLIKEVLL